jgi:hypothetical protein
VSLSLFPPPLPFSSPFVVGEIPKASIVWVTCNSRAREISVTLHSKPMGIVFVTTPDPTAFLTVSSTRAEQVGALCVAPGDRLMRVNDLSLVGMTAEELDAVRVPVPCACACVWRCAVGLSAVVCARDGVAREGGGSVSHFIRALAVQGRACGALVILVPHGCVRALPPLFSL